MVVKDLHYDKDSNFSKIFFDRHIYEHLNCNVIDQTMMSHEISFHNNISVKNNGEKCNHQYVYPAQDPSSQCHGVDYQFVLVCYDKEFELNFSITAGALGGGHSVGENSVIISFTNYWSSHGDLWGQIVFIDPDVKGRFQGSYIWAVNHEENLVSLVPFRGSLGPLEIIGTLQLTLFEHTNVKYYKRQELLAAKQTYEEFYKDINCFGHHACSYTTYMSHIIDQLLSDIELFESTGEAELHQLKVGYCDHQSGLPAAHGGHINNTKTFRDYNIPDKTVGYLALEATSFEFFGPDRAPVKIDSIETCLRVADVILSTKKPNYREARIPIESGLNVKMWEKYLHHYLDDRLIQYIKFGFPLSIQNPSQLHNKDVCNHQSALQYPIDIQKYLDKEIKLGVMLGPFEVVRHPGYHCSPLMSRPKEGDSRRVILDLSYPRGSSVNDQVSKERFDGNLFA